MMNVTGPDVENEVVYIILLFIYLFFKIEKSLGVLENVANQDPNRTYIFQVCKENAE